MRRLALLALTGLLVGCSTGTASVQPPVQASAPATPTATPVPTPTPIPQLSLTGLFHPSEALAADPGHMRTLIATGDIITARMTNIEQISHGFTWAFAPTADYVKNADITYVNLETPLFAGCKPSSEGLQFCGDARNVQGLQAIGSKVANLANNHLGNYGPAGTQATVDLLEKNGIKTSGLGPPAILEVRGLRFAFVGFNGVGVAIDRQAMVAGIQYARAQADVVVVQFHWGKEYERQPMPDPGVPTPDNPVEIGHLAVDSGADIVIGNHPHWYQGIEIYKNKLITYAHGNYVFDQMWSEETREGVIGTYTFYDKHLVAASWKPLRIYQYGQAQWMNDADSARVLATMEGASKTLAARLGEPTG
ncbi:MAG: CapA family protein [Chloroflexi bacterium]|nr:MAG: CapA family protein [Chloroflexota bacterium]